MINLPNRNSEAKQKYSNDFQWLGWDPMFRWIVSLTEKKHRLHSSLKCFPTPIKMPTVIDLVDFMQGNLHNLLKMNDSWSSLCQRRCEFLVNCEYLTDRHLVSPWLVLLKTNQSTNYIYIFTKILSSYMEKSAGKCNEFVTVKETIVSLSLSWHTGYPCPHLRAPRS